MASKIGNKQHSSATSPVHTRKAKLTENRGHTPVREAPKHARIGSATLNIAASQNQEPAAVAANVRSYVEGNTILGRGSHASIVQGVDEESGSPVAIKRRLRGNEASEAQKESTILKIIQGSPHCLALRSAYDVSENEEHIIVTDYVEVQDLFKSHLAPDAPNGLLCLDHIISIGKQSLEAFAHLRKIGIIHGDLKPENMTYSVLTRRLTILDWGCSLQVDQPVYLSGPIQTSEYRAPEVILEAQIDPSADLWSLGCVLYGQFTGKPFIESADNWANLQVSNNILLQKIAFQIGLPSMAFLSKCRGRDQYFEAGSNVFSNPLDLQDTHWKDAIAQKELERNLETDQIAEFIRLLEMMLRYDNRPPPKELLKLPIFKKDISIQITDLGSIVEAVMYRAEDIDAYLSFKTAQKPSPVFEFKQSTVKRHPCHHLPSPGEYIFCNKAEPLSLGMKRVRLLEDSIIDASLFQNAVFQHPEPLRPLPDNEGFDQLFGGIAEFF